MSTAEIIDLAIIAIAAGRASWCISRDEIFRPLREIIYRHSAPTSDRNVDGMPWRMLEPYRTTNRERELGAGKWDYDSVPTDPRTPGFWGSLIECPYCTSFWVSVVAFWLYQFAPDATVAGSTPLAMWAIATLYAKKIS